MEDKKNIVIKVKYPAAGKRAEHDVAVPKSVTQWDIKRILSALAGLVLVIAGLLYFMRDTEHADLQPQVALPEKAVSTLGKQKIEANKNIVRAQLALNINNNEPAGEISLPLKLSKKAPASVYYFVELAAMKGRTVYHEWLLDGELITRKKVNISDDNWRTSSRQLFAYNSRTHWTARLVDETGHVLNEIPVNVIYE